MIVVLAVGVLQSVSNFLLSGRMGGDLIVRAVTIRVTRDCVELDLICGVHLLDLSVAE